MGITWNIAPSNKDQTLAIPEANSLPKPGHPGTGSSKALTPIVDKLSVMLAIKPGLEAQQIHASVQEAVAFKPDVFQTGDKPLKGFKRVQLIALPGSHERVRMDYAYSLSGEAARIRLEFNPAKIGPKGISTLHTILSEIVDGGWQRFVMEARITRLDLAIDLAGIRMSKILFMPKQGSTVTQYKQSGKLGTYQQGKVKGNHTQVYNKGLEQAGKGKVPKGKVVRIERRLKPPSPNKMHELSDLKNPFAGIILLSELPGPPPVDTKPWLWKLFGDSVAQRGLGPALAIIPAAKRTTYRKHIKSHCPNWWDPDESWKHWPAALQTLTVTKGLHPAPGLKDLQA